MSSFAELQKKYFPKGYVTRLTQSVFDNRLLAQLLPVFLQDLSIESCGPFPLKRANNYESSGVLAQSLLKLDTKQLNETEIASHSSHRITLKFYIKLIK